MVKVANFDDDYNPSVLGGVVTVSTSVGGDLSGTLGSLTVTGVNGVAIAGTPIVGQRLESSSGTAAAWVTTFSTAVPANLGTVGSVGTATTLARSDHVHLSDAVTALSNPMTSEDDLIIGGALGTPTRLAKGSNGYVLQVDNSTGHLVWAANPAGFSDPLTTKGDIIARGTATTRLPVGSDGDILTADSSEPLGVKWTTLTTASWTTVIDTDPMSSLSNWTSRSGSWSAGTVYGVNGTANVQDAFLEASGADLTTYPHRAIQATLRVTGGSSWFGIGFSDSGTWSGSDLSIGLNVTTNRIQWDKFGSGGGTIVPPGTATLALDTDYDLLVVEQWMSTKYEVFLDGTYAGLISTSSINTNRVGLYARYSQGYVRDVSIYGHKLPTP